MRKITISILILFFITSSYCIAQERYHNCGMQGNAKRNNVKALNRLKNRYTIPTPSDFNNTITINSLLQTGDDTERFNTNKAVTIEGYVFKVKNGGKETCNCTTAVERYKDIHIELVQDYNHAGENDRVIVEVTPRLKQQIFNQLGIASITTRNLKNAIEGKTIRVKGWLFFDEEHTENAYNTNPDNPENNWRATCWEVHPITSIEVIE